MQRNINILLTSILLLGIVFSLNMVSAAIAFATPVTSGNYSTNIAVNVTYVNNTDIRDPLAANTTFYQNSSGSWAAVTCSSVTINAVNYACTIAITALTDVRGLSINMSLGNASTITGGTIVHAITADDTTPSCTSGNSLRKASQIDLGSTNSLTCTCTDNLDSAPTYTRLLYGGNSVTSITQSPYTTQRSDVNSVGSYTFNCEARDFTGNNVSNNATFGVVDGVDDAKPQAVSAAVQEQKKVSNNTIIIGFLVLFLGICGVIAVVWALSHKK